MDTTTFVKNFSIFEKLRIFYGSLRAPIGKSIKLTEIVKPLFNDGSTPARCDSIAIDEDRLYDLLLLVAVIASNTHNVVEHEYELIEAVRKLATAHLSPRIRHCAAHAVSCALQFTRAELLEFLSCTLNKLTAEERVDLTSAFDTRRSELESEYAPTEPQSFAEADLVQTAINCDSQLEWLSHSSLKETLNRILLSLRNDEPVLVCGPLSSFKTTLVQAAARMVSCGSTTASDIEPIAVQISDSVDSKSLLGSYVFNEGTCEFRWLDGPLLAAFRPSGSAELGATQPQRCVVLEDVDAAENDVLSTLINLIETRRVTLPNGDCVTASHLRLLATARSVRFDKQPLLDALVKHCRVVDTSEFVHDTSTCGALVRGVLGLPQTASETLLGLIAQLRDFVGRSQLGAAARELTLRDVAVWCSRVAPELRRAPAALSVDELHSLVLHGVDVFAGWVRVPSKRVELVAFFASLFSLPQQDVHALLQRQPQVTVESEQTDVANSEVGGEQARRWLRVGRARLLQESGAGSGPAQLSLHGSMCRLLESVASCVEHREPVLLVGETGCGKTTAVQYLATRCGRTLSALNLSRATDAAELIGGFKPVDVRALVRPVKEQFLIAFASCFDASKNARFLERLHSAFARRQLAMLVRLMLHVAEQALAGEGEGESCRRLEEPQRAEWAALHVRLAQLAEQMATRGGDRLLFSFVDGALVRALKRGEWLLLDEANLAPPGTLQCLAPLLDALARRQQHVTFAEYEQLRIPIHRDFRLFASMNPSTDVGKHELTAPVRAKFTELFVDELTDHVELHALVCAYLESSAARFASAQCTRIVQLYLHFRELVTARSVTDSVGRAPNVSLRTLCRALREAARTRFGSAARSLYEALSFALLAQLDAPSASLVQDLIRDAVFADVAQARAVLAQPLRFAPPDALHVLVDGYALLRGPLEPDTPPEFVLTPTVRRNLDALLRLVAVHDYPVLIQGETSIGKTSLIHFLARRTGNVCVRVNNHEHTELEDYVGAYGTDPQSGALVFRDGLLVEAMRHGYWLILDELNLASCDILEALNRLLDAHGELLVAETQERVRAHPRFALFATQNPVGLYAGRKHLSKAFRNRFVELHFGELPAAEMCDILARRCALPAAYARKLVAAMQDTQRARVDVQLTAGGSHQQALFTLRDLFRCAARFRAFCDLQEERTRTCQPRFLDYDRALAECAYLLVSARLRNRQHAQFVKSIFEKHFSCQLDDARLFQLNENTSLVTRPLLEQLRTLQNIVQSCGQFEHLVFTPTLTRMAVHMLAALRAGESVLLVGETGCGKTTLCQLLAKHVLHVPFYSLNCHLNTEAADLIGSLRPVRHRAGPNEKHENDKHAAESDPSDANTENHNDNGCLFEWQNGPLLSALLESAGALFLLDEISLADDSVLERLNSLLEHDQRCLVLYERAACTDSSSATRGRVDDAFTVRANDAFCVCATMNPAGDFGKKELSTALRNRFTEIWCSRADDQALLSDLSAIIRHNLHSWCSRAELLADMMIEFLTFFVAELRSRLGRARRVTVTVRDALKWVAFIRSCTTTSVDAKDEQDSEVLPLGVSYMHGCLLAFLDALSFSVEALALKRIACLFAVRQVARVLHEDVLDAFACELSVNTTEGESAVGLPETHVDGRTFRVGAFSLPVESGFADVCASTVRLSYSFAAPTTRLNLLRLARAMRLPRRAILLEGSPGVGKTSLVQALADAVGARVMRINLSEQTDVSDLFGLDLPKAGGRPGEFEWCDGPLLSALRQGSWILLDELNLASQAVLESLNSVLDHRGSLFVPELAKTFALDEPGAHRVRIFACQNPLAEGGGRKGLPQSFLNRFTQVYCQSFVAADYAAILDCLFADVDPRLRHALVHFGTVQMQTATDAATAAPNLRDLVRLCEALRAYPHAHPLDVFRISFAPHADLIVSRFRQSLEASGVTCPAISLPRTPQLVVTERHVFIGLAKLARASNPTDGQRTALHALDRQMVVLEQLAAAVELAWPVVLCGAPQTGKTSLVQLLAALAGRPLRQFALSPRTDALEFLGSFEQFDFCSKLHDAFLRLATLARILLKRHALLNDAQKSYHSLQAAVHEAHRLDQTLRSVRNAGARATQLVTACVDHVQSLARLATELELASSAAVFTQVHMAALSRVRTDISALSERLAAPGDSQRSRRLLLGSFEWVDSCVVQAIENGDWLLLDNANLCPPSVLDRLNSVLESAGELLLSEKGCTGGAPYVVRRHADFRLFLTCDPRFGPLSKAFRNRCVELIVDSKCSVHEFAEAEFNLDVQVQSDNVSDVHLLLTSCGLAHPPVRHAASQALQLLCRSAHGTVTVWQLRLLATRLLHLLRSGHSLSQALLAACTEHAARTGLQLDQSHLHTLLASVESREPVTPLLLPLRLASDLANLHCDTLRARQLDALWHTLTGTDWRDVSQLMGLTLTAFDLVGPQVCRRFLHSLPHAFDAALHAQRLYNELLCVQRLNALLTLHMPQDATSLPLDLRYLPDVQLRHAPLDAALTTHLADMTKPLQLLCVSAALSDTSPADAAPLRPLLHELVSLVDQLAVQTSSESMLASALHYVQAVAFAACFLTQLHANGHEDASETQALCQRKLAKLLGCVQRNWPHVFTQPALVQFYRKPNTCSRSSSWKKAYTALRTRFVFHSAPQLDAFVQLRRVCRSLTHAFYDERAARCVDTGSLNDATYTRFLVRFIAKTHVHAAGKAHLQTWIDQLWSSATDWTVLMAALAELTQACDSHCPPPPDASWPDKLAALALQAVNDSVARRLAFHRLAARLDGRHTCQGPAATLVPVDPLCAPPDCAEHSLTLSAIVGALLESLAHRKHFREHDVARMLRVALRSSTQVQQTVAQPLPEAAERLTFLDALVQVLHAAHSRPTKLTHRTVTASFDLSLAKLRIVQHLLPNCVPLHFLHQQQDAMRVHLVAHDYDLFLAHMHAFLAIWLNGLVSALCTFSRPPSHAFTLPECLHQLDLVVVVADCALPFNLQNVLQDVRAFLALTHNTYDTVADALVQARTRLHAAELALKLCCAFLQFIRLPEDARDPVHVRRVRLRVEDWSCSLLRSEMRLHSAALSALFCSADWQRHPYHARLLDCLETLQRKRDERLTDVLHRGDWRAAARLFGDLHAFAQQCFAAHSIEQLLARLHSVLLPGVPTVVQVGTLRNDLSHRIAMLDQFDDRLHDQHAALPDIMLPYGLLVRVSTRVLRFMLHGTRPLLVLQAAQDELSPAQRALQTLVALPSCVTAELECANLLVPPLLAADAFCSRAAAYQFALSRLQYLAHLPCTPASNVNQLALNLFDMLQDDWSDYVQCKLDRQMRADSILYHYKERRIALPAEQQNGTRDDEEEDDAEMQRIIPFMRDEALVKQHFADLAYESSVTGVTVTDAASLANTLPAPNVSDVASEATSKKQFDLVLLHETIVAVTNALRFHTLHGNDNDKDSHTDADATSTLESMRRANMAKFFADCDLLLETLPAADADADALSSSQCYSLYARLSLCAYDLLAGNPARNAALRATHRTENLNSDFLLRDDVGASLQCGQLLGQLETHIGEKLERDYPEHPALRRIRRMIEYLLRKHNVATTSVHEYCCVLQQFLEQVECDLLTNLPASDAQVLCQQFVRPLLQYLIEHYYQRVVRDQFRNLFAICQYERYFLVTLDRFWFPLLAAARNPALSQVDADDWRALPPVLDQFVATACVGDFDARLFVLRQLRTLAPSPAPLATLLDQLTAFYDYVRAHFLAAQFDAFRTPLESKLRDSLEIHKWVRLELSEEHAAGAFRTLHRLKQNTLHCKNRLAKLLRSFRQAMDVRLTDVLASVAKGDTLFAVRHGKHVQDNAGALAAVLRVHHADTERQLHALTPSWLPTNARTIVRRLLRAQRHSSALTACERLNERTEELRTHFAELQQCPESCADAARRKRQIGFAKMHKYKVLHQVFALLTSLGVSWRRGCVALAAHQQPDASTFVRRLDDFERVATCNLAGPRWAPLRPHLATCTALWHSFMAKYSFLHLALNAAARDASPLIDPLVRERALGFVEVLCASASECYAKLTHSLADACRLHHALRTRASNTLAHALPAQEVLHTLLEWNTVATLAQKAPTDDWSSRGVQSLLARVDACDSAQLLTFILQHTNTLALRLQKSALLDASTRRDCSEFARHVLTQVRLPPAEPDGALEAQEQSLDELHPLFASLERLASLDSEHQLAEDDGHVNNHMDSDTFDAARKRVVRHTLLTLQRVYTRYVSVPQTQQDLPARFDELRKLADEPLEVMRLARTAAALEKELASAGMWPEMQSDVELLTQLIERVAVGYAYTQLHVTHELLQLLDVALNGLADLLLHGLHLPVEVQESQDGDADTANGAQNQVSQGGMGLSDSKNDAGVKDVSEQIETQDQLDDTMKKQDYLDRLKQQNDGDDQRDEQKPDLRPNDNAIEMTDDFDDGQLATQFEDEGPADDEKEEDDDKQPDMDDEMAKCEREDEQENTENLDERLWNDQDKDDADDAASQLSMADENKGQLDEQAKRQFGQKLDGPRRPESSDAQQQEEQEENDAASQCSADAKHDEPQRSDGEAELPDSDAEGDADPNRADPFYGSGENNEQDSHADQPDDQQMELGSDLNLDDGEDEDDDEDKQLPEPDSHDADASMKDAEQMDREADADVDAQADADAQEPPPDETDQDGQDRTVKRAAVANSSGQPGDGSGEANTANENALKNEEENAHKDAQSDEDERQLPHPNTDAPSDPVGDANQNQKQNRKLPSEKPDRSRKRKPDLNEPQLANAADLLQHPQTQRLDTPAAPQAEGEESTQTNPPPQSEKQDVTKQDARHTPESAQKRVKVQDDDANAPQYDAAGEEQQTAADTDGGGTQRLAQTTVDLQQALAQQREMRNDAAARNDLMKQMMAAQTQDDLEAQQAEDADDPQHAHSDGSPDADADAMDTETDAQTASASVDVVRSRLDWLFDEAMRLSASRDTQPLATNMDANSEPRHETQQSQTTRDADASDPERSALWRDAEARTSGLSVELQEQLRIILEPRKADKLQGDYRTGKRLNMRKLLQFVASDFRKDRIWLRRTKKSKRDYQIMLAIDDSESMNNFKVKQMAFESILIIANALTMLEAGQLAIVGFGDDVRFLHNFGDTFSTERSRKVFESFSFSQKRTRIAELLHRVAAHAKNSSPAGASGSSSALAPSISAAAQLCYVVTDGRGIMLEGYDVVKKAVLECFDSHVFVILIVLDNCEAAAGRNESVLDIKVPVFKSDGSVEFKSYLDGLPFPFYVLVRQVEQLPSVLADALKQWLSVCSAD